MKSNKIHIDPMFQRPFRMTLILLVLLLHGCAGRPWTSPLTEEESGPVALIFQEMQQRDATCSCCLDAKAILSWDGPGQDQSVAGFLQLMLPTSFKFVILNPLGQPLYALVSDGREFQSINTTQKQHLIGKISSLATEYNIPEALFSDNWGYWLTGRLQEQEATIETIRRDDSGRGAWITMRYPDESPLSKSHFLIHPDTKQLLARILIDRRGDTIATISYDQRTGQNNCAPVSRVSITDLPYGSKLTIALSEFLPDRSFTAADFRLKVPGGYLTKELQEPGDR